jgi:hypothetical protein
VRAQDLIGLGGNEWAAGQLALNVFLGASDGHCFSVEPHAWVDLREPQITKGLAHFLNAGGSRVRTRRILALLQAVRRADAPPLDIASEQVIGAHAIPEAPCDAGRRIDVIAWVQLTDGRRIGTVIEAKVGHHVTPGQLACYEAAAEDTYALDVADSTFLVVAPSLTNADAKELRPPSIWTFVPWRVLLTRLGSALAASDCDHDDFLRFRRTVWSCAA